MSNMLTSSMLHDWNLYLALLREVVFHDKQSLHDVDSEGTQVDLGQSRAAFL